MSHWRDKTALAATKQSFIARAAAAMPVTDRLELPIRLRFNKYGPQQLTYGLTLQQQAAEGLGGGTWMS
jgi:hypothetical protein